MSGSGMGITPALVSVLRAARSVAVLTGSGVSAESGVPTFRDAQTGLWARYEPQELATPEAFELDPRLVWEWYEWRRGLVRRASPNPGHLALAEIERRVPSFSIATQNVDGLHQRAGSENVLELHGSIMRSKCSVEGVQAEPRPDGESIPPSCPGCGAFLRPDVVWFGEALQENVFAAASAAARNCDVFLSVGTSSLVYPAASLPSEAARSGAVLVEVNVDDTPKTLLMDYSLRGRAGEVLPALARSLDGP